MERLNSSNFNLFYSIYYNRCFMFAKSYVHNNLVAEDIASEAMIKLWELSKSEEIIGPSKLLYVIIKNRALDHLKHEKVKQDVLTSISDHAKRELDIRISTLEVTNPEKIFSDDIQNIFLETVAKLPPQTRMVFEMSHLKNASRKSIADHLNISVRGVDYHISKALSALRENLKDYFILIPCLIINNL